MVENKLILEIQSKLYKFNADDVLFIVSDKNPHQLKLVTKKSSYIFYGKLRDLEDRFPIFFRCNRSSLVNLKNVTKVDRKNRILFFDAPNNETLGYSRRSADKLFATWMEM